jgi:hypothetical protein
MATTDELKAEYLDLQTQLAAVNTQILAIIKQKNKKYLYSNQETTHSAETQSLPDLIETKKYIKEQMIAIENQLAPIFIQFKN